MLCPECRGSLRECRYDVGHKIGFCPECRGIWFDAEGLSRFVKEIGACVANIPDLLYDEPAYEEEGKVRLCPVCVQLEMETQPFDTYYVDQCPHCKGIWLDRGEIVKIVAQEGERLTPERPATIREELLSGVQGETQPRLSHDPMLMMTQALFDMGWKKFWGG
jgi:Zn-finger nucleic acid-binding protein